MKIHSATHTTRRHNWQRIAVLCGAMALALTGCAAENGGDGSPESPETSTETTETDNSTDAGLTAEKIKATIEPQGFECTIEDARLDSRDQVVACKGDNYVIISATSLVDPGTMQDQLASAKDTICKNQKSLGVDALRTGVSGKWIFTPGGDDDGNLEAFDAAMTSFGMEWNTDPC